MVISEFISRLGRFVTGRTPSKIEEFFPEVLKEDFSSDDEQEYRRKYISGLFYCGGHKRQYFAETYEPNDTIRETELLDELESSFPNCSNIRENFGYSDDIVDRSEVGAEWPEIEVGEL